MKKLLSLILVATLILGLAACGKKKEESVTTQATAQTETTAPAATEAAAGMANPMEEITDDAQFGQELGIDIDTALLYADAKLFITDGRVAECRFSFENIMGETVDCTLRATKDETLADSLPGVYDDTLKAVNSLSYASPEGAFTITVAENDAQDTLIYTWKTMDTWYSVVMKGKPSQMEVAEVMDSVLFATGIDAESVPEGTVVEDNSWYELSDDGEVLTVRLSGNATTGFQWSCKIRDEKSLEIIGEGYTEDAHADGMVGVGGVWEASFRATGPDRRNNYDFSCSNDISFTYARDWEDGSMPSKVLDLEILGAKIEIIGVHQPDFSKPVADDGEYDVTLEYTNMIKENDLSYYALVGIPETAGSQDGGEETQNKEYRTVQFTNETVVEDGMEKVIKTGDTGSVYDKMRRYRSVDAKITVKDGVATKLVIYYHP